MKLIGHSTIAYTDQMASIDKKNLERLSGRERYFDPTHVSNMAAWYKADAITGFNEGDLLDTWVDSSGNGHTMVQATDARKKPTYHATGAGSKNLPCVEFIVSSTDYMATTDIIVGTDAPISFAMFIKSPIDTSNYVLSAVGAYFAIEAHVGVRYHNWAINGEYDVTDNWRSGFGCDDDTIKKPVFKNGFYMQYDNNWSLSTTSADIPATTWYLGKNGLDHMQGNLAELIIYNTRVDSYVYAPLFHQYFTRKYGDIAVYS